MLKKISLIIGALILALFAAELLYFVNLLSPSTPAGTVEAVIVLGGSRDRVEPGYKAAREYGARYLVISPASARLLGAYGKICSAGKAEYILEDKARTTFENAFYAKKIIDAHHIKSVILVTSVYHMPRAFLPLKLSLLGQGVMIEPLSVDGLGVDWNRWYASERGWKIVYNEMVKLWGSLGEMAFCEIRGRLPEHSPKRWAVIRKLKSWLLFRI